MTRIREGRPGDLPALRAIQEAVLAEPWQELLTVAVDGPPTLLVATEPAAERGEAATSDSVAANDGTTTSAGPATPVGYALAVTDGGDAGYLAELAVAPGSQGAGHGSALVDALVERLREAGVGELRVTVREVDERAREFYGDRGFERRERIADHYETGDGLLLVRELEGENE
ncbi:GNAT family N-acetyltransferase [Halosimplex aquaticum]|uniref:GNAT family N-acetyltransferase n=1 Tax=Halosimplex aquaticum TaxID=3026162 RepID=A0ABD5XVZ9_9EURY|nr:N-acetyltransferase [Halosimplex aquaticum]